MRFHRASAHRRGHGIVAGLAAASALIANVSCTARGQRLSCSPHDARDALFDQATRASRGGDLDDARRCYDAITTKNPRDDEASAGLARIDAWSGNYERSERIYRAILTRHATDDDVRAGLFNVLVWTHRWDDAQQLLDDAPHRTTPMMLALKARLLHTRGDVTAARDLAERAERASGGDAEIRAVKERIVTRSMRLSARTILLDSGDAALGQADVSYSQAIHRLQLSFDTQQGTRPTGLSSGWVYGATYGAGAMWTFGPGLSIGTELAVGAPAKVVPVVRARGFATIPIRPWLSSSLGYTFRRFADPIDTHGIHPSIGIELRGELRIDFTYWLTNVRIPNRLEENTHRWVQAASFSIGRTMLPWLALRAGYAHGAEAEAAPTMFQLLDLVNDSFFAAVRITPAGFFSIEPIYGMALRGRPDARRSAQHTVEIGVVFRQ